jgi:Flp pilus assembly protein TadG
MTAGPVGSAIGLSEGPVSIRETVMTQQSVRQAARRAALDAQAVLRKERADRERRIEALAVAVLTAIGERDGAVWDAERRAGEALRTMTDDEGLSVRAAADWCGNAVNVREVTRLRRLAPDTPSGARLSA